MIKLELSIHGAHLTLSIINLSAREVRLWEWENSWGWFSVAIQVRDKTGKQVEIRRKIHEWTKNGPVYFTLRQQERREVLIDLHDGWWEVEGSSAGELASWQDQPLELRARLQIDPTPESERFDVFTGVVFSDWISSRPPHRWLPAIE